MDAHRRVGASALTLAVAVAVAALALSGCTAGGAVRTRPNDVERAAVAAAAGYSLQAQTGGAPWIQLWTPNQAGGVIERCVETGSGGVLSILISPPGRDGGGLSFEYGTSGSLTALDAESGNGFGGGSARGQTAAQLVDDCVATTPIDARRLLVPRHDWAAMYSYDVTVLRRCLLAHGQTVPSAPDRARYEGLLRASAPWSPYDQVKVAEREDWYALSDACPALPRAIAGDVASVSTSATTP